MSPEQKDKRPKELAKVVPSVRNALGDFHATGIEIAFNFGIPVQLPVIPGLSPVSEIPIIDIETSIKNILANPTDEEKKRWEGKSEEEIRADIEAYLQEQAK